VILTALCENGSIYDYYTKNLMPVPPYLEVHVFMQCRVMMPARDTLLVQGGRRFDTRTAYRLSIGAMASALFAMRCDSALLASSPRVDASLALFSSAGLAHAYVKVLENEAGN
jgi:hypothetical protein